MEVWTEIRRKVLVDKASKRSICREFKISPHTLKKILTFEEPPGYRRSVERPRPKLGAFVDVIDQILEDDKNVPKKQRHTARRIFDPLRVEYGYQGCESQVRALVALHREPHREVFIPLSQPPGEAQFDFGEAWVDIGGQRIKAALAIMTLPFSDAFSVLAYPRECTETFQDSHDVSFQRFGGVPTKVAYDNSTIAVKRVLYGPGRELQTGFLRLQSHFLFTHRFCRVARGNEKGHVENLVGYARRNFLVPIPSFATFAQLNEHLAPCCERDLDRTLRGYSQTKRERLDVDRAAMLALPSTNFDAARVVHAKANSLSLVRFDRNDYSVPTAYAHARVVVRASVDSVRLSANGSLVATHPRSWQKAQTFYDPRHYLALLERKPGAQRGAAARELGAAELFWRPARASKRRTNSGARASSSRSCA